MNDAFFLFPAILPDLAPARPLLDFTAFIIGACIGSFLNVVVWRLPRCESLLYPASHCPRCHHQLRPWENVPILAWLYLGARCSACKGRISARYPLVELFTAVIFLLLWRRAWLGLLPAAALPGTLVLAGVLTAAALIDLEHRIIPDRLTGPAMIIAIGLALLWPAARPAPVSAVPGGLFGLAGWGDEWARSIFTAPFLQERVLALKTVLLGAAGAMIPLIVIRQCGLFFWGRKRCCPAPGTVAKLIVTPASVRSEHLAPAVEDNLQGTVFQAGSLLLEAGNGSVFNLAAGDFSPRSPGRRVRLRITGERVTAGRLTLPRQEVKKLVATLDSWSVPREVLGRGDIKLLAVTGAFTGLEPVLLIILLASFGATLGGSLLLAASKLRRGWSLPFGPYIAGAGLLWLLAGERIVLAVTRFSDFIFP